MKPSSFGYLPGWRDRTLVADRAVPGSDPARGHQSVKKLRSRSSAKGTRITPFANSAMTVLFYSQPENPHGESRVADYTQPTQHIYGLGLETVRRHAESGGRQTPPPGLPSFTPLGLSQLPAEAKQHEAP